MSLFKEVTIKNKCKICNKPDWCSVSSNGQWAICRRIDNGTGSHKLDKNGCDYWLYQLHYFNGQKNITHKEVERSKYIQTTLETSTISEIYSFLLSQLQLTPYHNSKLLQRGLSQNEITQRQYRTLPDFNRSKIAQQIIDKYGIELCRHLPGLYEKISNNKRYWSIAGASGILIPVRDIYGNIIALKIRTNEKSNFPRYSYMSSKKYGGASSGSHLHVPLHYNLNEEIIRITEGELKADIATVLSKILTISIPGVSMWRLAINKLNEFKPKIVRLAFDMDADCNCVVANSLHSTATAIIDAGYKLELEKW